MMHRSLGRLAFFSLLMIPLLGAIRGPARGAELDGGRDGGAAVVLARDGKQVAPVVFEGMSKGDIKGARRWLLPVLEKMTGGAFDQQRVLDVGEDAKLSGPALVLRISEGGKPGEDTLAEDGYRIHTAEGRVTITGGGAMGVYYGFFGLMEKLGCRFWSYNEQKVPEHKTVAIPSMDVTWRPPFPKYHGIKSKEAETTKNGFAYKSRATSPATIVGGHNLYKLLTPYARKHPGIYPLVKGKGGKMVRKPNHLHFDYTAPGIARALADAIAKEVEKRHGNVKDYVYFAGMGDWYGGMSQDPRSKAIYKKEAWTDPDGKVHPGYSATLLMMVNKAARILEKKYPGIRLGTFAYMSLEAPPAHIKPADNVMIYVPRLRHDGVHPVDTSPKNRSYWLSLKRWCRIAPGRVYVWEYGNNFKFFLSPYPDLVTMSQNIKAYHRIGVAGLMIQSNYVSMGGNAIVMKNYVWSHMMRDPSRDIGELLQSFIKGYYGPAAPAIGQYVRVLHNSVIDPVVYADEFSDALKTYLTPAVRSKLRAALAQARKLAKKSEDPDYLRRVKELGISVDAPKMWKDGPLVEKDGHLIRADIGHNTLPRAKEMKKYNRGTTLREWGHPEPYWQDFFRKQGGPVATLRGGGLVVKAEPGQREGVGPILFQGKAVIATTYATTVRYGAFDAKPSDQSVKMTAEAGIRGWSRRTKYLLGRRVTFRSGAVDLASTIERKSKDKSYASPNVPLRTLYPKGKLAVSWRDAQGQWHKVTDKPRHKHPVELHGVTAWRVEEPGVTIVDEYQPRAAGEQAAKDGCDAEVGVTADHQAYTQISIPAKSLSVGKAVDLVHRSIQVQRR